MRIAGNNAFKKPGASKLATPRLLRLTPEDKVLVGNTPLKDGRFTWITDVTSTERTVVATCGNYTVLWNFRRCALLLVCLDWQSIVA